MTEKILLPLDGSRVGEAALPIVEELITKLLPGEKVEVTLIQVLSSLSHYVIAGEETARVPYTPQEIEQMKKQASQYLRKAGEPLKEAGATTKTRVAVGHAADEIINTADEINADIIAMSSHGRSGLSRWAFGSVTDRVLRGGSRPVLVVKAPKET
ncbi:universal stress protein [Chloroflexota bacterium]